jgi:hypothetical protein
LIQAKSTYRGPVLRYVIALLIGIFVGAVLVGLYAFANSVVSQLIGHWTIESLPYALDWGEAAAIYSAFAATVIAILCVPIWLLLIRFRLAGWHSAAALGFLAPIVYWVVTNFPDGSILELVQSGIPYGICGIAAGLATWWASPLRRANVATLSNKACHSESAPGV